MQVRTFPVSTTGRYLVEAASAAPSTILLGFHGYGQNAEEMMRELLRIPRAERRVNVAVQALHWFYRGRTGEVVASWMTKLERIAAIERNVAYAAEVARRVREEFGDLPLAVAGFSQGAAMAWRAAAAIGGVEAIVILGGDLPPDVAVHPSLPPALLGRGSSDEWYSAEALEADAKRLRDGGATVETLVFDGGHEWAGPFVAAAGRFLSERVETASGRSGDGS
jgi:predicted esterase